MNFSLYFCLCILCQSRSLYLSKCHLGLFWKQLCVYDPGYRAKSNAEAWQTTKWINTFPVRLVSNHSFWWNWNFQKFSSPPAMNRRTATRGTMAMSSTVSLVTYGKKAGMNIWDVLFLSEETSNFTFRSVRATRINLRSSVISQNFIFTLTKGFDVWYLGLQIEIDPNSN